MLKRWFHSQTGNVTTLVTVLGAVVVVLVGGAVDAMSLSSQQTNLKSLADEAALSGAKQLIVSARNETALKASIAAYIADRAPRAAIRVASEINFENSTVAVALAERPIVRFPSPLRSIKQVEAKSIAQASGQSGNVCMISLSNTAARSIDIRNKARVTGRECGIYSNSISSSALKVSGNTSLVARLICVAGGVDGPIHKTDTTEVVTDCPRLNDPLASRARPNVGTCDYTNKVVTSSEMLLPGTYCGGLEVDGGQAKLASGEYIIKDGALRVTNGGSLQGSYVGFYLTGSDAVLDFGFSSTISLTAPKTGTLSGLLFFAPGANTYNTTIGTSAKLATTHAIRSDDARRMVGTIYLPGGKLLIDGRSPIADQSEYTVIIAEGIELQNGPNLILRSDYDLSDVPVPDGVGPVTNVNLRLISDYTGGDDIKNAEPEDSDSYQLRTNSTW